MKILAFLEAWNWPKLRFLLFLAKMKILPFWVINTPLGRFTLHMKLQRNDRPITICPYSIDQWECSSIVWLCLVFLHRAQICTLLALKTFFLNARYAV